MRGKNRLASQKQPAGETRGFGGGVPEKKKNRGGWGRSPQKKKKEKTGGVGGGAPQKKKTNNYFDKNKLSRDTSSSKNKPIKINTQIKYNKIQQQIMMGLEKNPNIK